MLLSLLYNSKFAIEVLLKINTQKFVLEEKVQLKVGETAYLPTGLNYSNRFKKVLLANLLSVGWWFSSTQ
jgi:hypothetical protein